jgi:hypothetical protein
MAGKAMGSTGAATQMGVGVTSFAQPVVDRDGQVYTDKGVATGWMFLEWPQKISPRSLAPAMQVVDGTIRGVLPGANVVLTTRNGGYVLQVQYEGLEAEINLGEEVGYLIVAQQASANGQGVWQADFTQRLQAMLKAANQG